MKIAIMSKDDYAGSGWLIGQAVNTVDGISCTHIRGPKPPNRYGYKAGIQLQPGRFDPKVQAIIDAADIIHLKGDDPPTDRWWKPFVIPKSKPVVITVSGSRFRDASKSPGVSRDICLRTAQVSQYVEHADARVTLTPDLNYKEFEGQWIPAPIDVASVERCWSRPKDGCVIIGHSPSSRGKKGTDTVLLPSVQRLNDMGIDAKVKIIEGVSHSRCVAEKKGVTIFWGQSIMGAYGNSSLEAMQFGIPTMCWLSQESISRSGGLLDDCPIVNFEPTVDSCVDAFLSLINGDMDKVSEKTRAWTERMHSFQSVGKRYSDVYKSILTRH